MKALSSISAILVSGALATACTNSPQAASTNPVAEQQLEAASVTPPTVTFTASPLDQSATSTSLIVDIADQVVFTWAGNNATQATSWYTVDSEDGCGNSGTGPFPWFADTITGTYTYQYMSCQQGHTYTYYYVAENTTSQGTQSTQATIVVTVNRNGTH